MYDGGKLMKITESIERITNKILQKTIDLQKKQIKTHKEQITRHERLMKQLMQELDYPAWKIKLTIMANYKKDEE
jgi:hypothetical protein